MSRLRSAVLSAVLVLSACGPAAAAPVEFLIAASASGSLGGTPFISTAITMTASADTADVGLSPAGYPRLLVNPTVAVAGIGSATFSNPIQMVTNADQMRAGFGDLTLNKALLGIENPAIAAYDLTTSIGPLTDFARFNPLQTFPTTAGLFSMHDIQSISFQATVVPEPASLIVAAIAIGVATTALRRVRR